MGFKSQLAFGHIAESKIARFLRSRGSVIMPVYELEHSTGKGPQVFWGSDSRAVAPDLIVYKNGHAYFIEAKHKSYFSWHRITKKWCTGIDLHHYRDYLQVAEVVQWPVWLCFLHENSNPDPRDLEHGCPSKCPVGLFTGNLSELVYKENHKHENWGRSGMVYWAVDSLKKMADISELKD